jgi:hypothetical protein
MCCQGDTQKQPVSQTDSFVFHKTGTVRLWHLADMNELPNVRIAPEAVAPGSRTPRSPEHVKRDLAANVGSIASTSRRFAHYAAIRGGLPTHGGIEIHSPKDARQRRATAFETAWPTGLALKTIAEGTDPKVITGAYRNRKSGWTIRSGSISFTISIPARGVRRSRASSRRSPSSSIQPISV